MNCITGSQIKFQYSRKTVVLEGIDFQIESGKMTALLGKNGCGKSTLVKLIAALLPLSGGSLKISGMDVTTPAGRRELRERCGIIFQNPDNQFVSPVVEDDICFGLTNHHIPESKHTPMVRSALESVGLEGYEKRLISTLSGGQKQRAAAAAILAIRNDILIFDEAASMLDPDGKAELLRVIEDLRNAGKTIIIVTQNTEDVIQADHILIVANGRIIAAGPPEKILTDAELLKKAGIQVPFPVRVYYDLLQDGIRLPHCPLTAEELAEEICSLN